MGLKKQMVRARLRTERQVGLLRAAHRMFQLSVVQRRTAQIRRGDILLFATLRNERVRLPYFLDYYRRLGVAHFLFVDNGSTDGGAEYLAQQPDVSLWRTDHSYKKARFGMDWLNALLNRYAAGHWSVVVDVDEFLIYPHWETRPLRALTAELDANGFRSFGAILLDMYAKTPLNETRYEEGQDPFEQLCWFDAANYSFHRNARYRELWIQGGPRQRVFFPDAPHLAPALNKVPLVRWSYGLVYRSSMHVLLRRGLNHTYFEHGGERLCGALLHAKFIDTFAAKAQEEVERKQHYAGSREYKVYDQKAAEGMHMWTPASTRYEGWVQLEDLGLISTGSWA